MNDPRLGHCTRTYRIAVPGTLVNEPVPLLLGFHGQGNDGSTFATAHSYEGKALSLGWLMVHPFGIDTEQDPGHDTGWNCGTGGDDSTCLVGTTNNSTHASCAALGTFGRCDWSTCYDDVAFIMALIADLEQTYCLDTSRFGVVGQSNGGMLIHHLITSRPGRFRTAVPCFGTPLLGYLTGAGQQLLTRVPSARRTAVLSLHGRSDPTIPAQGGADADGWLYETLNKSGAVWAAVHGCDPTAPARRAVTPWDTAAGSNMRCDVVCRTTAPSRTAVARCMYDGGHGYAKNVTAVDEIVWAFFQADFAGTAWPPEEASPEVVAPEVAVPEAAAPDLAAPPPVVAAILAQEDPTAAEWMDSEREAAGSSSRLLEPGL